jgi:cell division protein FtsN
MSTGRLISVGTFPTRNEAEVVQGLLASAGISATVEADDAGGAYPFVFGEGAHVLVDEEDATAASQVLARGPAGG